MSDPLLLIDSYAQIYRGYYAVRALSARDGRPTNAIFAMTKFLLRMEREYPGSDGAFVFDQGKPPHRLKLAPAYKANRPPMPDDLRSQLSAIREMIDAFGWIAVQEPDWEADDLIGVIAGQLQLRDILIVSADKDLSQLINSRVRMLVPDHDSKGFSIRGEQEVMDKFGVPPSAIVDYLAMIGDAADNIPGLEGVGPKTAAALLNQFKSIEDMLQRAPEIAREKLREKVLAGAALLHTNIELVRLVTAPPSGFDCTPARFVRRKPDYRRIRQLAESFELRSIVKELEPLCAVETPSASDGGGVDQPELF